MTELANLQAPTLADFETLAHAAYESLPETFRALCEGVVIRVDDFPDDETLKEMDCETEFDLLGLFRGVGLAQGGGLMQTGQFPNMVWLYRRPLLDYWANTRKPSAISSPTCSCTKSAIISASPTTTWRRSRPQWDRFASGPHRDRELVHRGLTQEIHGWRGPDDGGLRGKAQHRHEQAGFGAEHSADERRQSRAEGSRSLGQNADGRTRPSSGGGVTA